MLQPRCNKHITQAGLAQILWQFQNTQIQTGCRSLHLKPLWSLPALIRIPQNQEKTGWEQREKLFLHLAFGQYLTMQRVGSVDLGSLFILHLTQTQIALQCCRGCQPTAEITWSFSASLDFFLYSVRHRLWRFLSPRLKFLNISLSTAVPVRDDLKTAKKGGSTRGLYVTGFPCQIRLRACQ